MLGHMAAKKKAAPARGGAPLSGLEQHRAVVYLPVAQLSAWKGRQARTHSPEQVLAIARAIERFGFTNPLLIDERRQVLAGNGRLLAAQKLGLAEVPTIELRHLKGAEKRAYVLADNRIAELAGWDDALLGLELQELRGAGIDLALAGFDPAAVDRFIALAGRTMQGKRHPDEAPPLPEVAISRVGDAWQLGAHRIACGDATKPDVVAVLFSAGRKSPHLMVTDPPYGVEYDPQWRARAQVQAKANGRKLKNDDQIDWRSAWALAPCDVAYVWHAGVHAHEVAASLVAVGFEIRSQIIWIKNRFVLSRGNYHWGHEPALYAGKRGAPDRWQNRMPPAAREEDLLARFDVNHATAAYGVRKGKQASWEGGRKQSTVWEIDHLKNDTGHATQKPIDAMKRPIENNSQPGDGVYDPFLGSGTTLIACEMTGRVGSFVELDERYVDVAVRRWQDFTGRSATHVATGEPFAAVEKERAA